MSQEVGLDQLNLPQFGVLSMTSLLCVRSVAYPIIVLKTRLQVQEVRARKRASPEEKQQSKAKQSKTQKQKNQSNAYLTLSPPERNIYQYVGCS